MVSKELINGAMLHLARRVGAVALMRMSEVAIGEAILAELAAHAKEIAPVSDKTLQDAMAPMGINGLAGLDGFFSHITHAIGHAFKNAAHVVGHIASEPGKIFNAVKHGLPGLKKYAEGELKFVGDFTRDFAGIISFVPGPIGWVASGANAVVKLSDVQAAKKALTNKLQVAEATQMADFNKTVRNALAPYLTTPQYQSISQTIKSSVQPNSGGANGWNQKATDFLQIGYVAAVQAMTTNGLSGQAAIDNATQAAVQTCNAMYPGTTTNGPLFKQVVVPTIGQTVSTLGTGAASVGASSATMPLATTNAGAVAQVNPAAAQLNPAMSDASYSGLAPMTDNTGTPVSDGSGYQQDFQQGAQDLNQGATQLAQQTGVTKWLPLIALGGVAWFLLRR